ncbi:MAG: hypothetical protein ACRYGR_09275 [Janthinobacterium lividum]
MTKFIKIAVLLGLIAFNIQGFASSPTNMIKQATKQCEKDVATHCLNDLCPKYCERVNARRNNDKLMLQCKKECTLENRCKLKPLAGMDDSKNLELDAQTREQLIQCIAETRDPEGTKSGRRMISWKSVETSSWSRLMKP